MLKTTKINRKNKESIFFIVSMFTFFLFLCASVFASSSSINVSQEVVGESGGGEGGGAPIIVISPPAIYDLNVHNITFNSAEISWKTNEPASAQLDYGETVFYEKGTLKAHDSVLLYSHKIGTINLRDNKKYYFRIRSKNSNGIESSKTGSFVTLQNFKAPANVSDLIARPFEGKIILSWKNPDDDDFAGVQINKSINSPALNVNQGDVIYSGKEENFADKEIESEIRYYYSVFSYDSAKNFSSGAIAFAISRKGAAPPAKSPDVPLPKSPDIPPKIFLKDVEDLKIVENFISKEIEIKWINPDDDDFWEVEVYKNKDFPALIPGGGEIIYKGKENSFKDKNIKEEEIYFYTIFTKDKFGNYSAGKSIDGTIKEITEKPPFSQISGISMDDVFFISSQEALLFPQREDNKITIFPNKEINIYYDAKNLPDTLKTIIVTVNKSSYILNSDKENNLYKAKFLSPKTVGNYPIIISVLDFKLGKIYQTRGEMIVEKYGVVYKKLSDTNLFIKKIKELFAAKKQTDYALAGANVALYKFDEDGKFVFWDGKKFNQYNPQITNDKGEFGFIVPNGKYKIVAKKDGYITKTETIEVKNNIINSRIMIKKEIGWEWLILLFIITLFVVRIIFKKKN